MDDLMSKGLSEQEAFEKAKEDLAASSESDRHADLHDRFRRYYENRDPADYEAVGLLYGGFLFIGAVVGALIGYVMSGGRLEFLTGGWIDTLIGTGTGILLGLGLGQICHALIVAFKRK